jgi:hypothetical protein
MDSIKGGIILRSLFERRGAPDPAPVVELVAHDALPIFHWLGMEPDDPLVADDAGASA